VEASHIGLHRPVELALIGDAKRTLAELLEGVKAVSARRVAHERMAEFRGVQDQWRSALDAAVADETRAPMLTGSVFKVMDEFFGRDAIMVMDGGNTCMWGVHYHSALEPRSLLWTSNFGHLGTGLPYALGAKLACPERPVYCVTGDGAFGFHLQELETAVRQRLPVVVVVAVDGAWGMEKTSQNRVFGREGDWLGCDHAPVRYDRVAEAMGCHGEHVESARELRAALERAVESAKPAVVHAVVDAKANVDPPGMAAWVASHAARH
jgi:acetolactate synthase-1/2/3 large subunit